MFTIDQLTLDQLEEAAQLWLAIQGSECLKDNKKSEKSMFIKIKETLPNGRVSISFINKKCIEAVTEDRSNLHKMHIHVASGKTFKFDIENFGEIWPLINK